MATDATGTPTALGIPKFNTSVDAPSGLGGNAQMDSIDTLLQLRALIASPSFTGTPTAPTPTAGDNSSNIATTAFVHTSYAPLASPALTGTPTAPTALTADNSTTIATTAYVQAVIAAATSLVSSFNGRMGAVVPTTGDYTAAQVTNAGDKSTGTTQAFNSALKAHGALIDSNSFGGLGYTTGAGSAVTQTTSLTTAVTANSMGGVITTATAALSGGLLTQFTVNCSAVSATDTVAISWRQCSWGGPIPIWVSSVSNGSFQVSYYNLGSLTTSSDGAFNWAIIKTANS